MLQAGLAQNFVARYIGVDRKHYWIPLETVITSIVCFVFVNRHVHVLTHSIKCV